MSTITTELQLCPVCRLVQTESGQPCAACQFQGFTYRRSIARSSTDPCLTLSWLQDTCMTGTRQEGGSATEVSRWMSE